MSQYYLESILSKLDKESKLVHMIRLSIKNKKIDTTILNNISKLIKQEISNSNNKFEKLKLQKALAYVEQIRIKEELEERFTDIDSELETQLYDL